MVQPETTGSQRSVAQTLDRGLFVLESVLAGAHQLDELVEKTGLSRTVVHRLLSTLTKRGYLHQAGRGEWRPGFRLVSISSETLSQIDATGTLQEEIDSLAAEFNDTVHLGVLSGPDILYLVKASGSRQVQMLSRIGLRTAAQNTALGKAILAEGDINEATSLFDPTKILTEKSIRTAEGFREALEEARNNGYAVDNEEAMLGIICVSVVLPRVIPNQPLAAVSVSVPKPYMDDKHFSHIVSTLRNRATDIGRIFAVSEYPTLLETEPGHL